MKHIDQNILKVCLLLQVLLIGAGVMVYTMVSNNLIGLELIIVMLTTLSAIVITSGLLQFMHHRSIPHVLSRIGWILNVTAISSLLIRGLIDLF